MNKAPDVLLEVLSERERQDDKWGPQNHSDVEWNAIFGEEVGEAAMEVVEGHFSDHTRETTALRDELIQAAAVAVAWIEAIDRRVP